MFNSNRSTEKRVTYDNGQIRNGLYGGDTEQQLPHNGSEIVHAIEDAILDLDETLEKVFKKRNPRFAILGIE
jgi:hypothetical protein